jgi:CheY-like chemotaxis protein
VLVVDDNPILLRMMRDLLSSAFMDVRIASNGVQCLDELRGSKPDVIVLDMQLPGKDGFTIARELKSDPKTRSIPIVAVTSYAMRGDEERALAAGCDAYVSKPIDTRTFPKLIASYSAAASEPSDSSSRRNL